MTPVKNCIKRKECCKSKYRQISIIMNEEAEKMEQFMETEEGKKIFSQRARTVEAPYGTLKKEINIETCAVIGNEKRENIIYGITSSYNLKIIYNKIKKEYKKNEKTKILK